MKFFDSITIISLLIIVTMLITIFMNRTLSKRNQKTLIIIYLIIGLATLCEWMGNTLNGTNGNAIILHKIVVAIKLSITPIFPVIYANMVLNDLKNIECNISKIIYAVLALHVFIEIISIKYGFIFYIDKLGYRNYGKMYVIYMIICIISIIYFIKILYKFNKYFQNKNSILLFFIISLGVTGSIIQFTNQEHKVKWLCLIIASVLVYMYYNETIMYVDNLTELLNQAAYNKSLESLKNKVTILLFDIDDFKKINDLNGHNFGDFIISKIAQCIKETYEQFGTCYRKGGDEFCVILNFEDYQKLNNKFVSKLEEARKTEPRIPYVSIGCAQFDPKNQNILDAIENADKDLYYWKQELKKKRDKIGVNVNSKIVS